MEGLVVYSNTGKSPRLMHYYSYWERRVFDALIKVKYTFFANRMSEKFSNFVDGDEQSAVLWYSVAVRQAAVYCGGIAVSS
jgi:hypothetical protein